MIRKNDEITQEENLVVKAILERIEANKRYLDQDTVDFVIQKLETGSFNDSIMEL